MDERCPVCGCIGEEIGRESCLHPKTGKLTEKVMRRCELLRGVFIVYDDAIVRDSRHVPKKRGPYRKRKPVEVENIPPLNLPPSHRGRLAEPVTNEVMDKAFADVDRQERRKRLLRSKVKRFGS